MDREFKFDPQKGADLLGLLANSRRLKVLALIAKDEWSVSALATEVNLSQSALSQHLKILRDADVVNVGRDAQSIYYSCSADAIHKVLGTLQEIGESTSLNIKTVA